MIVQLLKAGYTEMVIATKLGVTIAEVRRHSPVPLAMTVEAWEEADALYPDKTDKELKALYNASNLALRPSKPDLTGLDIASLGSNVKEIAEALGISAYKVRKKLGKINSKPSTPNKIKDWDAVLSYYKANSLASTAKKFGVTPSAISQYIKRHKL